MIKDDRKPINTSFYEVFKQKLDRQKQELRLELEKAKSDRRKDWLKKQVAETKSLQKLIKKMERQLSKIVVCPNCGCEID
jgi:hypothetical protein